MPARTVLKMGHPILRQVAAPVRQFDTRELHQLLADMEDTMRALNGAGIAAPQIGVSLRVVVFEVRGNPRYPDAEAVPWTVLLNPELEFLGEEMEDGWEGCLSVPGLRGLVPRFRRLRYRGFDARGAFGSAPSRAFTPESCSTRSTTSMASSIRCGSRICATSATRTPFSRPEPPCRPSEGPRPDQLAGLRVRGADLRAGRVAFDGAGGAVNSASASSQSSISRPGANPRRSARK